MSLVAKGYSPSPRPTYDRPTLITTDTVRRHVWGDRETGLVADWIYASTERIHVLQFGVAADGGFRHSPAYRTVFGADEVLHVVSGTMVAANPETGEVVRAGPGDSVFFRRNTWHHAFAHGGEPLRVIEFFAPPPATGSSGPYARLRPYLEDSTYRRDSLLGALPVGATESTLRVVEKRDLSWRREGGILIGLIASTEHLTVGILEVDAGVHGEPTAHGGDAVLVMLDGSVMVRTTWNDAFEVFEAGRGDAVYLPLGTIYEVLSFGGASRAVLGVAPSYLR